MQGTIRVYGFNRFPMTNFPGSNLLKVLGSAQEILKDPRIQKVLRQSQELRNEEIRGQMAVWDSWVATREVFGLVAAYQAAHPEHEVPIELELSEWEQPEEPYCAEDDE